MRRRSHRETTMNVRPRSTGRASGTDYSTGHTGAGGVT